MLLVAALVGAADAGPRPARAAPAAEPSGSGWQVEAQLGGRVRHALVDGDTLYTQQGSRLVALDLSEPARPRERWRSRVRVPGELLAVRQGIVLVREDERIRAHRAAPDLAPLSEVRLQGSTGAHALSEDGFLALARAPYPEGPLHIELVDARDPLRLRVAARWEEPASERASRLGGLLFEGPRLYASAHDGSYRAGEVLTFDRREAEAPRLLARWPTDAFVLPLAAQDDRLVLLRDDAGIREIQLYDAADPAALRSLSGHPIPRSPEGARLDGDTLTLLVGCEDGDWCDPGSAMLQTLDVAQAEAMRLVETVALNATEVDSLAVHRGHAYISAFEHGIFVLRPGDGATQAMLELVRAPLAGLYALSAAGDLLLVDDVRFFGDGDSVLRVLRPNGAGGFEELGSMVLAPSMWGVGGSRTIGAERGYLALEERSAGRTTASILRLELTDPSAPRVSQTPLRFDDAILDLALGEGTMLVARRRLVAVVDAAEPGRERVLARLDDDRQLANRVALRDGLGFVLRLNRAISDPERLQVLDLDDPAKPFVLAELPLPDHRSSLSFRANRLLPLADGRLLVHGDLLVDASDPARPRLLGQLLRPDGTPLQPGAVANVGARVFLVASRCLYALDVDDAAPPRVRAATATGYVQPDLVAIGDTVYAASSTTGIEAWPAEPPAHAGVPEACGTIGWRPARHGVLEVARLWLPFAATGR